LVHSNSNVSDHGDLFHANVSRKFAACGTKFEYICHVVWDNELDYSHVSSYAFIVSKEGTKYEITKMSIIIYATWSHAARMISKWIPCHRCFIHSFLTNIVIFYFLCVFTSILLLMLIL
jgi:hypothetical protein